MSISARLHATAGAAASERWRTALELPEIPRWHVEIQLAAASATFDLNLYAEEWGFVFQHASRGSWIRVTDVAFVHGRDEHGLLTRTPDLLAIGRLLAELEREYALAFPRGDARVSTNIPDAEPVVREWLVQAT
ncbi:MAG TPA: hypothetical protein VGG74_19130 [Kofleriaceae bacterium]